MGMAEEADLARQAAQAERRRATQASELARRQWREHVSRCAAEFAQAARARGLPKSKRGLFRKPLWGVLVHLEAYDFDGHAVVTLWVDDTGKWGWTSEESVYADLPRQYGKPLAGYEEVRQCFVKELQRG